ncbi:hypothetical protein [Mycobacterium spongiae]|uniref:ARB-07466-like C-terminal domain-containing protein n=1 Tax=Mycobacterium spongiae TaxID=886343 RepID=A0A975JWP5_9MYCO|nr:hypothetical protein [Mycobacterium spongiae]QUR66068.1 hypothetical protein F6B93_02305 [Mycobacterium spongiae]
MGRHELTKDRRRGRRGSVLLGSVLGAAAVLLAAGADVYPVADREEVKPADDAGACCLEIVAAVPGFSPDIAGGDGEGVITGRLTAASRLHTRSRFLPAGVAPERGLQIRTILAARSISDEFPQIHQIGGVRPDPLPWHPNGLALDVMIPNPGSAEGIALGDAIVAFVLKNAARFGMQDAIWRGVYYTPQGAHRTGAGHYDHVHVTTTGGGYPTGREVYVR